MLVSDFIVSGLTRTSVMVQLFRGVRIVVTVVSVVSVTELVAAVGRFGSRG